MNPRCARKSILPPSFAVFPAKRPAEAIVFPVPDEIRNCSGWMNAEFEILRPRLVIPVGRLAIMQFIDCKKLDIVIGRSFLVSRWGIILI